MPGKNFLGNCGAQILEALRGDPPFTSIGFDVELSLSASGSVGYPSDGGFCRGTVTQSQNYALSHSFSIDAIPFDKEVIFSGDYPPINKFMWARRGTCCGGFIPEIIPHGPFAPFTFQTPESTWTEQKTIADSRPGSGIEPGTYTRTRPVFAFGNGSIGISFTDEDFTLSSFNFISLPITLGFPGSFTGEWVESCPALFCSSLGWECTGQVCTFSLGIEDGPIGDLLGTHVLDRSAADPCAGDGTGIAKVTINIS